MHERVHLFKEIQRQNTVKHRGHSTEMVSTVTILLPGALKQKRNISDLLTVKKRVWQNCLPSSDELKCQVNKSLHWAAFFLRNLLQQFQLLECVSLSISLRHENAFIQRKSSFFRQFFKVENNSLELTRIFKESFKETFRRQPHHQSRLMMIISLDWWWRWRRNVSFSLSASLSLFSALTLSSHAHLWSLKLSSSDSLGACTPVQSKWFWQTLATFCLPSFKFCLYIVFFF